jgi:hypothetical protein
MWGVCERNGTVNDRQLVAGQINGEYVVPSISIVLFGFSFRFVSFFRWHYLLSRLCHARTASFDAYTTSHLPNVS